MSKFGYYAGAKNIPVGFLLKGLYSVPGIILCRKIGKGDYNRASV